jgi:N-dimethylarginine dimethylaminohydrolase
MDASRVLQRQRRDRGEQGIRQISRLLVSRPDFYAITEARNPFARSGAQVDRKLALQQWERLCEAFQRAGTELSVVDPWPSLEDMCFTSSQFFVGLDRDERSFAIPSRMLHRSRRDEVEHLAKWYCGHGYRILDLDLEGEEFLEGAADLIWAPDWESVWAGYGHRSTPGAVERFAGLMESMGFEVRRLEMVDPYFYHLNLCLAPISADSLLIYSGAFAPEALASLRMHANTYEVSREDALHFICNGVLVNGYYITPRLTRQLEQILGTEGIDPIVVDLSEFHKAGGSAASLKMLLP